MAKFIIKFIVVGGLIFVIWFLGSVISGNGLDDNKTFVVKRGQGLNEISRRLSDNGFIKSKFVFETWIWLKGAEANLVAGIYSLPKDVSIRQLAEILTRGPKSSQSTITIVEGWNRKSDKLKEALEANGLSYEEFLDLTASKKAWEDDYEFLRDAPPEASLEGYLFPNTHFIDDHTTVRDLIVKILNDFDKKLRPELREEIKNQGKTIFEVITLASIVEGEVPKDEDKKMVADIFLKRLAMGIALQSDATVNFITGKRTDRPSLEDLRTDSPYNTYKYRGLPPGPISNPGLSSIEAVIYPSKNSYYYFLTTRDGKVIYSETYEEHLANKAKYLD